MHLILLFLLLLFGGLAIHVEFRNLKESTLFSSALLDNIPLFILCAVSMFSIYKNLKERARRLFSFLPFTIGLVMFAFILGHKIYRSRISELPVVFTATNDHLGTDGGFQLHFKREGHLVAEKIDHFSTTTYWGEYKQNGDTILLDIPLNFEMGRQAVIHNRVLRFLDDTVQFEISPN